jgi:hypothetical protein
MTMRGKISVNTHYTRSVNLERDQDSVEVLEAYIPTSRAIRTLERVASAFHEKQAPRAWSLIGPYGSGKSSFSVFASDLFSDPNYKLSKIAQGKLEATDPKLQKSVEAGLANSKGMLKVLVTGAPEPMSRRILSGFQHSLDEAWSGRRGKRPPLFSKLSAILSSPEISVSETIAFVDETQVALEKLGYCGVVLIIDELGKFLEYEARHYGANDIYLLQSLAEHACAGSVCNLFLFVMLHQSFEQYAKGLGENLKNEWSKVQGRFEEVPFIESSEQVLRVVSNAFKHDFTRAEKSSLKKTIVKYVDVLSSSNALPAALKRSEAVQLFQSCYPLHPVSALLLPLLCQKIAQNERTLFSYLGSHEDFGLSDMLGQLDSIDECVQPYHLFDYFIANQSAALSDYATHRRWAEVVTSLERLGDATSADIALLKTIGIMNIIGAKGGLKPSKAILELCLDSSSQVDNSLKALVAASVVTYRKFSGEYRVWQGSDFDLEEALHDGLNHIGEFELAETLNSESSLQPLVARRYTIKNGALRYFTPMFVDARSFRSTPSSSSMPRIVLFLAAAQDDEKIFFEEVTQYFSDLDIVAICKNGSQLRESTAEVIALRHVGATRQELASDPVAKREFEDRLTAAEHSQSILLSEILETPQDNDWYHRSKTLPLTNKREFQVQLSAVLEKVYCKAPELHNELVNRDKPSSQANAGRIKLLYAMITSPQETDLGIEKFPPEKAIYRSILMETKLHQETSLNEWEFTAPEQRTPFYSVWQRIDQFLDETEKSPMPFTELNNELMAPPYGVKAGILPILYIAVYCVYQQELAIYENRQYRPNFTEDMLDRFVKRPDEFAIQRFRIVGLRASIYEQYKTLFDDDREKTIIQLARPLAKHIGGLEEYTLKTRSSQLSKEAKGVRDAFKLAKSPEKLLFEDLPKAVGFDHALGDNSESLEGFANALQEALKELRYAYSNMVKGQQKLLAQAFHMSDDLSLEQLRQKSIGRYEGLEQYTVDVDGLRAFIKRVSKRTGSDEEWLENILMFLGHKPSSKWSDADRAEAEVKLSDFAKRILDLETLRLHYDKNASKYEGDFQVILLKSLKKGQEPIDEVVAIDQARHEAIQDVKSELKEKLDKHTDKELKLAILAELVDEFLNEYQKVKSEPKGKTVEKNRKVKGVQ